MSTPPPRASAHKNPWYVLATIMGEPTGSPDDDKALQAENRKVWNSWASQELSDEVKREKVEKSEEAGRDPFEGVEPWSEICGRIEAEFKNRLPDEKFPKPSERVDFENLSFEAPVSFKRFFFQGPAHFSEAAFTEDANFSGVRFTKGADFSDASFTKTADFFNTSFTKAAYFGGASFTENASFIRASFTKAAGFRGARFTKDVYFNSASFTKDADFLGASFTKAASFNSTTFTEAADFTGATFTEIAYFSRASFTKDAGFNSARFTKNADFRFARFTERASFSFATFEGRSYFQNAKFKGSVDFTDAGFDKPCNLREAEFTKEYPRLEGTNLHAKTTITADDSHWPPKNTDKKKNDVAVMTRWMTSCAHLRHNMAAQGLPEHAHFFFRREMALKSRTVSGLDSGWYWAYQKSSNFGHSLLRPFVGLVFLWGLMAVVLCLVDIPAPSALNPLQLSFANMFPSFLFSAREHLHVPWLDSLMWFQTILGTVLVFLFILGLRNRFRL